MPRTRSNPNPSPPQQTAQKPRSPLHTAQKPSPLRSSSPGNKWYYKSRPHSPTSASTTSLHVHTSRTPHSTPVTPNLKLPFPTYSPTTPPWVGGYTSNLPILTRKYPYTTNSNTHTSPRRSPYTYPTSPPFTLGSSSSSSPSRPPLITEANYPTYTTYLYLTDKWYNRRYIKDNLSLLGLFLGSYVFFGGWIFTVLLAVHYIWYKWEKPGIRSFPFGEGVPVEKL